MDIYHIFGRDLDCAAANIAHCVSLLLYLCSNEPDSLVPLPRPSVQRNKQQQIILPPLAAQEWYIGAKFGAAYRQTIASDNERQQSGSRHAVRPHVRRAHWHGYWHGKRTAKHRDYKLKWLPPVMVAVDDAQDLPVVVHPVAK